MLPIRRVSTLDPPPSRADWNQLGDALIGHCDWLACNLRWNGDTLLVVHDWDSMVADSEAVLVGFAAALFSAHEANQLATVEDTERFLAA